MTEPEEKLTTPRETGARWRRWVRVVLIVLALLLVVRLVAGWVTQRQLNGRLAEISAAGEPARLSDVTAAQAAVNDGWPLFQALIKRAEAQGLGAMAREQTGPAAPDQRAVDADKADVVMLDDFSQGPPRSAELQARLRARLAAVEPLLADLVEASACPTVTWPIAQNPLRPLEVPTAALLRLKSFLYARAVLEFSDGQAEAGAKDVLALTRLANQFGQMPFLLGVGVEARWPEAAWRALQEGLPGCGNLPAGLREELRVALASGADGPRLRQGTLQARALGQTLFEDIVGGRVGLSTLYGEPTKVGWTARVHVWFIRPLLARDQYNTLGSYAEFLKVIDKPYWELDRPTEQIMQAVAKKAVGPRKTVHAMDSANAQAMYGLVRFQGIDRAVRAMAGTALELQYWRSEHGDWPDDLSAVAGVGGQSPIDLLTGRPLGYRPYGTPLLYSAGLDGADNAGTYDVQKDLFGQTGNDLVFFLEGVNDYDWRPRPTATAQPATATAPATQPATATATAP